MHMNYLPIGMNNPIEKDKQFIWHPFTPQEGSLADNIFIIKGEGIYLHTDDGRKIIDAISSWWVNLHGHSHPKIAEALAIQARELEHVMFAGFTHQPAIDLAEKIISILPDNFSKIFYSDNGSTANEVAIKMAIQYWHNKGEKKKKIIALEGAYHGDTFGAMAVGERSVFTVPFTDYLFQVEFIDFPTSANEEAVVNQFQQLLSFGDVGMFIFEPLVQGASGMRMYSTELLDTLISLAKQHNVICIADEVFTGFYRTGRFLAIDHLQNKPDIVALSKGLTGGTLPMGITACTKEVYEAFLSTDFSKAFLHGHSYTANPLACAAANVSFNLLIEPATLNQVALITNAHKQFLKKIKNHKKVKDVRSLGTILAVEINNEGKTAYTNSLRDNILNYFLKRNILLRPLGNIMYVVPPYIIKEDELERVHQAMFEFLNSL
jgi:adenosylmethionine---8-amino-7-oxononanoate aminotransferase